MGCSAVRCRARQCRAWQGKAEQGTARKGRAEHYGAWMGHRVETIDKAKDENEGRHLLSRP